jgi:DNA-binding response OmpR family regulator
MTRILTVDDDPIIIKVLTAALHKAGYSVSVAKDGFDAVEIASRESFDLFILDVNLPGGVSGFNILSTLRNNPKTKSTPIMFLTGRKEKADVMKAVTAGANDYLVKPIDTDILLAKVEALLEAQAGRNSFQKTSVSETGVYEIIFDIIGISEQGINIVSPVPLTIDSKLTFKSPLFDAIGFQPSHMRVISCNSLDIGKSAFAVNLSFIGLTEGEHKLIRQWIIANHPHKTKNAGSF